MKIEVTSQSGISFSVELTEDERQNIKDDLDEITEAADNLDTENFLQEIKKIL